jgi:demethylspheroidene O-methyltransferase
MNPIHARSTLALLFNADKALDLVRTARDLGLLERLDAGPATLRDLAEEFQARPLRLYKFLDGLESLGLVERRQDTDDLLAAEYVSTEPLVPAVEAVLGENSIERDRDRYPWRDLHGRLREVLTGGLDARFSGPPETAEEVRAFERSMTAGCGLRSSSSGRTSSSAPTPVRAACGKWSGIRRRSKRSVSWRFG